MKGPTADVLVLGSGVAGLTAARTAAEAGLTVAILTKGELAASATRYAQGGVAAALSPGDSPELHFSDTLSAGGGLCDPEAVRVLVGEGPARLRELMALGASFDRTGNDGAASPLALAREGGHSLARVVHAGGDATGHEVERALVAATITHPRVTVHEGWLALSLHIEHGQAAGVWAAPPAGERSLVRARDVVLACGGAGQLYSVTTNPALSTGDGVAMALAAGAAVADVEFMQFHPTALHHPVMPRPLLSEALRGDGAVLRDDQGITFMVGEHPLADLAPRDVVSRAIARRLVDRGLDHLWLDATGIDHFPERFPTIWSHCRDAGLDPTQEWLPVAPAAHYLCGGVVTDINGASSLPGLWACGEVADTGIHGANRLASNSLLEGLVFGHRVAQAIAAGRRGAEPTGAMRGVPLDAPSSPNWRSSAADRTENERQLDGVASADLNRRSSTGDRAEIERQLDGVASADLNRRSSTGDRAGIERQLLAAATPSDPDRRSSVLRGSTEERQLEVAALRDRLQRDMTTFAGVLRDGAGLAQAVKAVAAVAAELGDHADGSIVDERSVAELSALLAVAGAVVSAAAERKESRGCHHRLDFPDRQRSLERIVHFGPDRRLRVPASMAVSEHER